MFLLDLGIYVNKKPVTQNMHEQKDAITNHRAVLPSSLS